MMGGAGAVASPRGMDIGAFNPKAQQSGDNADRVRGAKTACYAQVYLDGVQVYTPAPDVKLFDLNTLQPDLLKGVEFFPGPAETPAQYGGTGASCGTLLLWTK